MNLMLIEKVETQNSASLQFAYGPDFVSIQICGSELAVPISFYILAMR
jgi:hypothetical protein